MMKLSTALVVACVLFVATEAHTSSAYGNSIASTSFRYTFNEHVRKAFVNGEQARAYMKDKDQRMKARFLTFQAKAEKAVKQSGLPVAPYDLFLPAVRPGKAADVAKIDKKAYPLNLVIDVGSEGADELFEITLKKPVTAAQVAALKSVLKSTVKTRDVEGDPQALIDAARFEVPVAVTHIDERFGLYVGTTTEVPVGERERVLASLRAALDALLPKVRERFAAADVASKLQVEGLQAMKPVDAKTFNPWGPLASGEYVRVREDMGHVSAILMVAPSGKWEWDKVYPGANEILQSAAVVDEHRALIESENDRLDGIER